MTDNTELRRLADELIAANDLFNESPQDNEVGDAWSLANDRFTEAASPEVILALIAESDSARKHWQNESNNVQVLVAEVARLKAENEALRREREGKVHCDLELFETLRDAANTEADEHRQCMATYRPLRQANLDSVVKKCDDLLATVGQKAPAAEIIWCACGDGHAANSYGAGFMDANGGVCANCDAAMGKGERS